MKVHLMYCDDAGESHWRDVDVSLTERIFAPPAQDVLVSDPRAVSAMLFLRLDPGWNEPVHVTPKAQTLICLRGTAEATASDGEMRVIGPGDVWQMEDTAGKGHHTRVTSQTPFDCVIVQGA